LLHPTGSPEARLVSLTRSGGLGAEKFLLLGTRLKHLQEHHGLKKVVLTSSGKSEGKSLVAANLAISLARNTKQKVLLLEGDLRGPVLSRLFGHNKFNGLTELLRQKEPPGKFLYRMAGLPLWILFAGTLREHPLQLLQSSRLPQLLNQFSESFDWILIDAPPLLPLADADLWTRLSDGVLLVVRENRTPKKILQKALDSLGKAALLGLVLNEASGLDQNYYEDSPGWTAGKNHRGKRAENGAAS
jgi:polysaccharide biosynthesis transport protein